VTCHGGSTCGCQKCKANSLVSEASFQKHELKGPQKRQMCRHTPTELTVGGMKAPHGHY
jgi:hypothetical protein